LSPTFQWEGPQFLTSTFKAGSLPMNIWQSLVELRLVTTCEHAIDEDKTLQANIDRNSAFSLQQGQFGPNFQVEGVALHQPFFLSEN